MCVGESVCVCLFLASQSPFCSLGQSVVMPGNVGQNSHSLMSTWSLAIFLLQCKLNILSLQAEHTVTGRTVIGVLELVCIYVTCQFVDITTTLNRLKNSYVIFFFFLFLSNAKFVSSDLAKLLFSFSQLLLVLSVNK